jgi:hypothetical protein
MASVVESIMQPDESAIKLHLETLFAPLREEYPGGVIELRHGDAFKSAYFNLHPDGIADAVAFASSRSRAGENIYVGVNPRKPGLNTAKAATDADVEIAAWQFADIDKEESLVGLGRKLRTLPPTFTLSTGTIPHRRPHLYWLLEEPVRNMGEWTQRQRGIAHALGGDAVINPSRIMRLAGTVNLPAQHKVQRGYRVEVVSIRTEFDDEREPVTPDEVSTAFPPQSSAIFDGVNDNPGTTLSPGQSTLAAMRPTKVHDLLEACRSGDQWHNAMIRLVAHLAAIGRTSAEIIGLADHITLAGYTVEQTRRDMLAALHSARTKWDLPEPVDAPVEQEEAAREEADAIFELLDMDEIEAMPPPTWLIHEMIVDDGLTVLYGTPGAGKSFVSLDMGLRLAHGMEWHGRAARATGVLYIAGEGARGLGKRVKGWRKHHEMEGVEAPFLLLPVAVELLDEKQRAKLMRTIDAAIERAGFAIGLVVVDTVSRALSGADENGQEAMGAFVAACDAIKRHTGGALIGVHHSGKDKDRGMRGSTVLLGACDAVIMVDKAETLVTLKTEKQKDAEQAEPIYMQMATISWAQGLGEEQTTLVPVASTAPAKAAKETLSQEQITKAFGMMADAWGNKRPLSIAGQAKALGRYAPRILAKAVDCKEAIMADYITAWLEAECLAIEVVDTHSKARGLQVLDVPGLVK